MMRRWWWVAACMVIVGLAGCGKKALGPADADEVPTADPEEVRRGMEESMKHMPGGVRPQSLPGSDSQPSK